MPWPSGLRVKGSAASGLGAGGVCASTVEMLQARRSDRTRVRMDEYRNARELRSATRVYEV